MSDTEKGTTVIVSSKGQVTIPKQFREKLHIDTPGQVRFIENEDRETVLRPIKRRSELRDALGSEKEDREKSATELLRKKRERDKRKREEKYGLSEQE